MFKFIVFFAFLAVALAAPAPEAKADPKPWLAYSSPVVATAPVAYGVPLTYAAAPLAYNAYPAYSAYASPYVATVY